MQHPRTELGELFEWPVRKKMRLPDYDYAQPGGYFVTICTNGMECLLGKIADGKMVLNDAGYIVEKWWNKLPEKFPNVILDSHVVMPNHFHGIICIVELAVGADLRISTSGAPGVVSTANGRVGPYIGNTGPHGGNVCPNIAVGADPRVGPCHEHVGPHIAEKTDDPVVQNDAGAQLAANGGRHAGGEKTGAHMGAPLQRIMQWFKTMTTNEYIRHVKQNRLVPFPGRLWQRSFHDRVIRDENECNRIREYIDLNPANWETDENYLS